ncbi:MAG: hypothetical protein M4579_006106 [Chaenotheca gracillima]|nr:MAG: hypothetical protein M4579_006106 [Chaenotheca gracillima]
MEAEEPQLDGMSPTRRKSGVNLATSFARGDTRCPIVIFEEGQEDLPSSFGDVLGKIPAVVASFSAIDHNIDDRVVVGIPASQAKASIAEKDSSRFVIINTHCVDANKTAAAADELLSEQCDYEFQFSRTPFFRRDLARFLSFVLGHLNHHENLVHKERTSFISTTFPDVRTALSNLDILSVGSDAVEIRVDLLRESLSDGHFSEVPSLKYVGEQVMLLRQRTELPIIFTTRCTRENGKFPMEDPTLFYKYLRRAIQWGCEYIDVELWLPEELRKRLDGQKGNSKIMSAFHDFSGTFKWTSPKAEELFCEGARYSDIVKMIAIVSSMGENYELEYFRSVITAKYPDTPFSAVNAGQIGQLSRALNTVFSPITHPLLPIVAAPGQLTAAEINEAMHSMGQLPKKDILGIGSFRSTSQALFFEKCFNELGLPHHFSTVDRKAKSSIESLITQPSFGGASINPPITSTQSYIPRCTVSEAAQAIGQIDALLIQGEDGKRRFVGDNSTWKGIRATLTRDFVPSAYWGRAALILSSSHIDAAPAVYALRSLNIGPIYSVGFKGHGPLFSGIEPFTSAESVQRVEQPFAIVSALPPEKSHLVQPLLRHFSHLTNGKTAVKGAGKVFVDLSNGPRKRDPLTAATNAGWMAYGAADVSAWTTVETLRSLIGQNVPYDFVRMASCRGLY